MLHRADHTRLPSSFDFVVYWECYGLDRWKIWGFCACARMTLAVSAEWSGERHSEWCMVTSGRILLIWIVVNLGVSHFYGTSGMWRSKLRHQWGASILYLLRRLYHLNLWMTPGEF